MSTSKLLQEPHFTVQDIFFPLGGDIAGIFVRALNLFNDNRMHRLENIGRYILPGHRQNKAHIAMPVKTIVVDRQALYRALGCSFTAYMAELKLVNQRLHRLIQMWKTDRIIFACKSLHRACSPTSLDALSARLLSLYPQGTRPEIFTFHRADFQESFITAIRDDLAFFRSLTSDCYDAIGMTPAKRATIDPKFELLFDHIARHETGKTIISVDKAATAIEIQEELAARFRAASNAHTMRVRHWALALTGPANRALALNSFSTTGSRQTDDYDFLVATRRALANLNIDRATEIIDYDLHGDLSRLYTRLAKCLEPRNMPKFYRLSPNFEFYSSYLDIAKTLNDDDACIVG